MSAIHVTKESFASEILSSNKPVLVDFWASWCGPCRMVGPIIEEIAQSIPSTRWLRSTLTSSQSWQPNSRS